MKHLLYLLLIISFSMTHFSKAVAQDDFFEAEMENEAADSGDDMSDDEDLDFETDDFTESGDTGQDTDSDSDSDSDSDQAQNNTDEEAPVEDNEEKVEENTEQEISDTANDLENSFDNEQKKSESGELSFQPASSYGTFRDNKYEWSVFVHYGYQFANVTYDFANTTSLVNLPNQFTDIGLDVIKKMPNLPYIFGGRLQMLTESVENSTYKAEYKVNLLTAFVGYKFIDNIVTVSGVFGLVLPASASAKLSTISGSSSADKDYELGLSYTAGIKSIISLKQFLVGFDGGLMFLQGQKLDSEEIDGAQSGYMRILLGLAF